MKEKPKVTYKKNGTTVSIDYGTKDPIFTVKIGDNEPLIEVADESTKAEMRSRFNVTSLNDLNWKNMMTLESICRVYYEIITEG